MNIEWVMQLFKTETAREAQARIDVARAHADLADALNDLSRDTSDDYVRAARSLLDTVEKHSVNGLHRAVADIARGASNAAAEAELPAGRVGLETLRNTAGGFAHAFGWFPTVFARFCVDPPKPTDVETETRLERFERDLRERIDTAIREIITAGIDPRDAVIVVGAALDLSFRGIFGSSKRAQIDAVTRSMGPESASVIIVGTHLASDPDLNLSSVPALLERPPVGSTWLVLVHEGRTVYLPLLCRLFEHWHASSAADA